MVFILAFMEAEFNFALFGFGVYSSPHEFMELVGEGVMEVSSAWHKDSGFGAICDTAT